MPHVVKLEKPGWTIYYDCDARLPVCVIESFKGSLPNERISRSDVGDPFRADVSLPKECRMYWDEYEDYMAFGGSPGHNAPASFHKSSVSDYRKTFLLSNICPQEVVFNGGLWVLLENLCRDLVNTFPRVDIYTGSVKGEDRKFGKSTINVPSHMYKIIVVTTSDGVFAGSFVMPNKPATDEVPIERFYKSVKSTANMIENASGFDVFRLLKPPFKSLSKIHSLKPVMTARVRENMEGMRQMGKLVYSKTLEELEENYAKISDPSPYHAKYFRLVKRRLMDS